MSVCKRAQAMELLKGHRSNATLVQTLSWFSEIALILAEQLWLFRYGWWLSITVSVATDILLLSPIKAGVVFFYDTLAADAGAVRIGVAFRFFRHGYQKCVLWRLSLWWRRLALYTFFCLPCIALVLLTHYALQHQNAVFALGSFLFAIVFFLFAIVATEIALFRYLPAVYLLTRVRSAKTAFRISRHLMHHRVGEILLLYLDYIGWFFSSIFIFPLFYVVPLFQVARAVVIGDILTQVSSEDLKLSRKRGKI